LARRSALSFQQLAEESDRGSPVPSGLDEDVNHVPVLVDRAPQVLLPALNPALVHGYSTVCHRNIWRHWPLAALPRMIVP